MTRLTIFSTGARYKPFVAGIWRMYYIDLEDAPMFPDRYADEAVTMGSDLDSVRASHVLDLAVAA
jgi:hypothetical protein